MKKILYCDAPWKNFTFFPDGFSFLCCYAVSDPDKGCASNFNNGTWEALNIKTHSIYQIRNSDTFKKVRLEMLNGIIPEACYPCKYNEKSMKTSLRLLRKAWMNFNYEDAILVTGKDGTINNKIKSCELRFSTQCNLKCRICSPKASHLWCKEYKLLMDDLNFVHKYKCDEITFTLGKGYWDELIGYLEQKSQINMTGGETMIIKEHWEFLQFLINNTITKDIELSYNINGAIIKDNAFDIWSNFKSIYLGLSLDDIGERCEYLRHGLKWDKVLANLDKIVHNMKCSVYSSFTPTLSWLNVYYLDEFLKFLHNYPSFNFTFYFLFNPNFLSPWILPVKIKKEIIKRCKPYMNYKPLMKKYFKILKSSLLNNPTNLDSLEKGITFNKWLDKSRHEDFTQTFPELHEKIKDYWDKVY